VLGLLRTIVGVIRAACHSRQELLLENAALRHQLEVALRKRPKPALTAMDRIAWVWLSKL
jgi:hypothetical protein